MNRHYANEPRLRPVNLSIRNSDLRVSTATCYSTYLRCKFAEDFDVCRHSSNKTVVAEAKVHCSDNFRTVFWYRKSHESDFYPGTSLICTRFRKTPCSAPRRIPERRLRLRSHQPFNPNAPLDANLERNPRKDEKPTRILLRSRRSDDAGRRHVSRKQNHVSTAALRHQRSQSDKTTPKRRPTPPIPRRRATSSPKNGQHIYNVRSLSRIRSSVGGFRSGAS